MITEEEKASIVEAVLERIVLRLPEIVGNLMVQQVQKSKITSEFYAANPDFRGHEDIIRKVVSEEEGMSTLDDYKDILERSVPKIRETIKQVDKVDFKVQAQPNRTFDNGVL